MIMQRSCLKICSFYKIIFLFLSGPCLNRYRGIIYTKEDKFPILGNYHSRNARFNLNNRDIPIFTLF